jgi:hypothetical protein
VASVTVGPCRRPLESEVPLMGALAGFGSLQHWATDLTLPSDSTQRRLGLSGRRNKSGGTKQKVGLTIKADGDHESGGQTPDASIGDDQPSRE